MTPDEIRDTFLKTVRPWALAVQGYAVRTGGPDDVVPEHLAPVVGQMLMLAVARDFAMGVARHYAGVYAAGGEMPELSPGFFYHLVCDDLIGNVNAGIATRGDAWRLRPGQIVVGTSNVGLTVKPGRKWSFSEN